MERRDAEEVVTLLKAAVGGRVEEDQLEFFRAAMSKLDYDKALAAATKGAGIWRYFPSWSQFREMYGGFEEEDRRERERVEREKEEVAARTGKREIPFWVRRWIAARFLYARFDREKDLRPFREQGIRVDQRDPASLEWMPDDEWSEEGLRVSDRDVWFTLAST